jgi:hypothetical protein
MSSNIVTQGCRTVRQCVAAAVPTLARLFRAMLRPPCLAHCRNCCLVNRFCHCCPSGEAGPNAWTDSKLCRRGSRAFRTTFRFYRGSSGTGMLSSYILQDAKRRLSNESYRNLSTFVLPRICGIKLDYPSRKCIEVLAWRALLQACR